MPALAAAAALGGVDTRRDEAVLPLVVDPAGVHRRRIWEAWATKGRAGRWPAIITAGAQISAGPLDQVSSPYRRPKPIEHRQESRNGYVVNIVTDPEDPVAAAVEDVPA